MKEEGYSDDDDDDVRCAQAGRLRGRVASLRRSRRTNSESRGPEENVPLSPYQDRRGPPLNLSVCSGLARMRRKSLGGISLSPENT